MTQFLLNVLPSLAAALFILIFCYRPYQEFLSLRRVHLAILKKGVFVDPTSMTFGFVKNITPKDISITLPRDAVILEEDNGLKTVVVPIWK
jgi:hypothetical protein